MSFERNPIGILTILLGLTFPGIDLISNGLRKAALPDSYSQLSILVSFLTGATYLYSSYLYLTRPGLLLNQSPLPKLALPFLAIALSLLNKVFWESEGEGIIYALSEVSSPLLKRLLLLAGLAAGPASGIGSLLHPYLPAIKENREKKE